jgi:hypothetical protein
MRSPGVSPVPLVAQIKLLRPQGIDNDLGFQIPNLDAFVGGGAQPISIGRKDERMDDFAGVERIEAFALVEIP